MTMRLSSDHNSDDTQICLYLHTYTRGHIRMVERGRILLICFVHISSASILPGKYIHPPVAETAGRKDGEVRWMGAENATTRRCRQQELAAAAGAARSTRSGHERLLKHGSQVASEHGVEVASHRHAFIKIDVSHTATQEHNRHDSCFV